MNPVPLPFAACCALLLAAAPAAAEPVSDDCESQRRQTARRIEANGVRSYSLQVVGADAPSAGQVVGHCDGGTRRIVYRQLELGDAALVALLRPAEPRERRSESAAQDEL